MTDAIGTTTSAAASANLASGQSNLNIGYNTFLQLLTTQLQHQDPTSPLDTNQFTTQLVQMTGVQQQLLSNQLLQTLVDQSNSGGGISSAVGMIGKTVHVAADTAPIDGGKIGWGYNLAAAATSATATVKNSAGAVVWTGALSGLAKGQNTFAWNGKDSTGAQLADGGAYTLSIVAKDALGATVTATPEIVGQVTSVQSINGTTIVGIGKTKAPLSSVTEVDA